MNETMVPVQTGPVYHCFACSGPATLFQNFRPCGSLLDQWSNHIWYLKLDCKCNPRVVRLGDCIAPLISSGLDGLTPGDIPLIRAGLEAIAHAIPLDERCVDPAAWVVYNLLAGTLSPDQAICQIKGMRSPVQPRQAAEMLLT
jgi:hypothetical protein